MEFRIIKTDDELSEALARIDQIIDSEPGTPENNELEILSIFVEHYEEARYPFDEPDPIEYLKNVMEFQGLTQTDLAELLRSRARASEILNKTRPLSLKHIRTISAAWSVPADPLIQEYDLQTA